MLQLNDVTASYFSNLERHIEHSNSEHLLHEVLCPK